MAKTGAERQREYRRRHSRLVAALRTEVAELRAEVDTARAGLAAARAEAERLAGAACKHPAGAVDGGTCRACGAEVW